MAGVGCSNYKITGETEKEVRHLPRLCSSVQDAYIVCLCMQIQ